MHSSYVNPAIRELRDQQVRFAPREKKLEQADLAERLLSELDPDRIYPYEYLCYRITKFRPQAYPDLRVPGGAARMMRILPDIYISNLRNIYQILKFSGTTFLKIRLNQVRFRAFCRMMKGLKEVRQWMKILRKNFRYGEKNLRSQ